LEERRKRRNAFIKPNYIKGASGSSVSEMMVSYSLSTLKDKAHEFGQSRRLLPGLTESPYEMKRHVKYLQGEFRTENETSLQGLDKVVMSAIMRELGRGYRGEDNKPRAELKPQNQNEGEPLCREQTILTGRGFMVVLERLSSIGRQPGIAEVGQFHMASAYQTIGAGGKIAKLNDLELTYRGDVNEIFASLNLGNVVGSIQALNLVLENHMKKKFGTWAYGPKVPLAFNLREYPWHQATFQVVDEHGGKPAASIVSDALMEPSGSLKVSIQICFEYKTFSDPEKVEQADAVIKELKRLAGQEEITAALASKKKHGPRKIHESSARSQKAM
jgi:hypothetical protein